MIPSTLCHNDDDGVFRAGAVVGVVGGNPHVASRCAQLHLRYFLTSQLADAAPASALSTFYFPAIIAVVYPPIRARLPVRAFILLQLQKYVTNRCCSQEDDTAG